MNSPVPSAAATTFVAVVQSPSTVVVRWISLVELGLLVNRIFPPFAVSAGVSGQVAGEERKRWQHVCRIFHTASHRCLSTIELCSILPPRNRTDARLDNGFRLFASRIRLPAP